MKFIMPKGMYGITSNEFPKYTTHIKAAKAMINAGIKIIQYRDKKLSFEKKFIEAKKIAKLCKKNKVIFIINDDPYLCNKVNAEGIHLGSDDLKSYSYEKARSIIGSEKIIGLSVSNQTEYSFALNTDCQYIGVGAIWTTQTKSDAKIISHDLLLKIIKENKKQIVAIGGINLKNIKELINIKIQTFCMISELLKADNMNHIVKYINH